MPKTKKSIKETTDKKGVDSKRNYKKRDYPVTSFEESFTFAKEIYKLGAGEKVRRLTIFDSIGKSPDSGTSRMTIINSNKYGLTKGSYVAEFLELTPKGKVAVSDEHSPVLALKAKFELAVSDVEIFGFLYAKYMNNKLPTLAVIIDILHDEYKAKGISRDEAGLIVETFIVNIKFLGLLQTISGAERLISIEHALEKIPEGRNNALLIATTPIIDLAHVGTESDNIAIYDDFDKVCFYITPIGNVDSEYRKHSDMLLESIISPALQQFDLKVVRADQIDKPGIITHQIIEYIFKSKLVVVDLSFHNPNVFYELALRHVCRLPTVQIIRKKDPIPFDLSHSRTIIIDTSDIYTLVPKLETHKAEIASQIRQVLSNPDTIDNPITDVFPRLKIAI